MTTILVRREAGRQTDASVWFIPEAPLRDNALLKSLKKRHLLPDAPFRSGAFTGKTGEVLPLFSGTAGHERLLLVGVGKKGDFSFERLRRAAATAAREARASRVRTLVLHVPDSDLVASLPHDRSSSLWTEIGSALAEGVQLGLYRYDKYRTERGSAPPPLGRVIIPGGTEGRRGELATGVARGTIVSAGTILARNLENAPGNEITPSSLAREARRVGARNRIRTTVLDDRRIRKLGMGGLLGVSRGSVQPPRFIIMEYNSRKRNAGTVVLVGKGVTFDAGGISIKPSANMAEMKMDMSGGAAVIGALQAAAQLKLPMRIVGLIPATENLPDGNALKPGDILRHLNGKTSEIDNTDAEGRLILADALSYAGRFSPDLVIDLATLTGAVVVALGHHATGMLGNDEEAMAQLRAAGERTYERVWQLPLFEEYERQIKSDIADVKNVGGRWGGAITAACFLKKFIGGYRWVHLDIAGTAIMEEATEYIPKGGSGVGVRLLIDFLRHWKRPAGRRER